jgi:regulator of sigma E protease
MLTSLPVLLGFVFVLALLILAHEAGHFFAAKRLGVVVEEFGLGFPPRLKKLFERDGTAYTLNWIPLGGFVRPRGENDPTVPGGLAGAPKRVRIAVLAAGSLTNLLIGFLVFVVAFKLGSTLVAVAAVAEGTPAAAAGLQAGDVIVKADNLSINYITDLQDYVQRHLGQPIQLTVEREGQTLQIPLTPRTPAETPEDQGPLGIELGPVLGPGHSWFGAIGRAAREVFYQVEQLVLLPGRLLRGQVEAAEVRPIGPVGLYQVTDVVVDIARETNEWFLVIQLVGLVSVAVALTNLLPLPALDGGRILFVLVEALRGRRVDPEREGLVHVVGMLMLLVLMALITYQDVVNLFPAGR